MKDEAENSFAILDCIFLLVSKSFHFAALGSFQRILSFIFSCAKVTSCTKQSSHITARQICINTYRLKMSKMGYANK